MLPLVEGYWRGRGGSSPEALSTSNRFNQFTTDSHSAHTVRLS